MNKKLLRRIDMLLSLSADPIDFTKKKEERDLKVQKENDAKQFIESIKDKEIEPEAGVGKGIISLEDKRFGKEVNEASGVWMHRFSAVHKDSTGFYILKSENANGNKMKPGDMLSDHAINMTPYWKVGNVSGDRINLIPIGSNPFLTGIGAGGAKLTDFDVKVFSGKHEKEAFERIKKQMESGDYDIDSVKYILLGTVPLQMGPNGSQGGWYHCTDRDCRGGLRGMKPEEVMKADAIQLKEWGLSVPIKAVTGEMDASDWDSWINGNGSEDLHVSKNLDKYVDFARKMTDKGKWRYSESDLADLRRRHSEEEIIKYYEAMAQDFLSMSKEEFQLKHGKYLNTMQDIMNSMQYRIEDLNKKKRKNELYKIEGEDDNEESVLRNVFHTERRVAIANVIKLINLAKEDSKYVAYLEDIIKMGGVKDFIGNEKIINFFSDIDNVDGLKLCMNHLKDSDNLRYVYNALINQGENEYVIEKIKSEKDCNALMAGLKAFNIPENQKKQGLDGKFNAKLIKFVEDNDIYNKVIEASKTDRYHAEELVMTILAAFGTLRYENEFFNKDYTPEELSYYKPIYGKWKGLYTLLSK